MSDKIIDRVKKMLALAKDSSATEGERDNALRMAYATLSKYNIDIDDLEVNEGRECLELFGFNSPWQGRVAHSIAQLFFCNYYFFRGYKYTHSFVGKTSNVTTAQMMVEYVIKSIVKQAGKQQRNEGRTHSWNTSFCKGASVVIMQKCAEMRKLKETEAPTSGTSLVLADLYKAEFDLNSEFIKNALNLKIKTSKSKERTAGAGYNAGKEFGDTINLSGQGGNNSSVLRLN
jgi:hypothetical protein